MGYTERIELYKTVEKLRKRPLIVYATSYRQNASAQMGGDVVLEFSRQLEKIPSDKKEVDILIVSNGGDPTVSWHLISMLKDRFKRIGALLPYSAYSAATLFALGADEILMHPFSNLGPVDPQLTYKKKENESVHFGSEDLRHFMNYVKKEVGISDQKQLEKAFELVCQDVGAIPIGVAKRSSSLALSMSEKLLSLNMKDSNKAKAIAEQLNTSFYHHGYPLDRKEAKTIGLNIVEPEAKIEKAMWAIWQNIELEMKCAEPFSPLEEVFTDPVIKTALTSTQVINLPSNAPPHIVQQVYQNIISQLAIIDIPGKDYELFQATLESIYCRSEFRTNGIISASRRPDFSIAVNVLKTSSRWYFLEEEKGVEDVSNE